MMMRTAFAALLTLHSASGLLPARPNALLSPRRGPTRLSATSTEGAAASAVRAYFEAWNRRDMEAAVALWTEDCEYEDTQYAGAFEGKPALRAHLLKVAAALPESFAFVVDDVADGGPTVGVRWHVEAGGKPLPFTRGASVYKADAASGLLRSGFDVPEPAPLKPGGAGLALLSLASKLIAEPLRALPLACFALYCQQLFLAEGQLLPGPSALALDGATWAEVRDLSLNFWFVGPMLGAAAGQPGLFPARHPGLEAIFNLVLAWSALFAGFLADGRRGRAHGSMLPTVAGMQLLTNAFFLPYLATRDAEAENPQLLPVAADTLGPAERAAESRALPLVLAAVGALSLGWAFVARPEFGDATARLASLRELLAADRLGASFVVDLALYAVFQAWLIPDDLRRRGVEGAGAQAPYVALGAVPFVGLAGYLLARPRLQPSE